jgi:transcriptional regulator with XRE-family HTH domain
MYLAVYTGLSPTFISDVENGLKEPCLRSLKALAGGFGVPLMELVRGVDRK